ncbi:MauE/DoxX family redox-associated membrane protein [Parapedobacter sp. 2B3]|uniref:MauE/DoxX family redox-associated membrane protein n=1 Tax=Parapedobacter sp. 2B3 TaxID=3342381 RepID=UPI0035B69A4A
MKTFTTTLYHWFARRSLRLSEAAKTKAFWSDAIIFICGLLFLYSALDKLSEYEQFRIQVGKSPILAGYEGFIAWFIPSIEILIVVLMIPMWTRQIGLYTFFTLMLLFTGYIILLLYDGSIIPCGCNALTEKISLPAHIWMNLLFCALAALGIFISPKSNFHLDQTHPFYREFIVPLKSSIRSVVPCFKRKEAKGNE